MLKLKDITAIDHLYTKFKDSALPTLERFHNAKELLEQCVSYILIYPESTLNTSIQLSTIAHSDRYKQYIHSLYDHFDFDCIKLLHSRLNINNIDIDDIQLLRRLASVFYMFLNDELSFMKRNIIRGLENQLKAEYEATNNQIDVNIKDVPISMDDVSVETELLNKPIEERAKALELEIMTLLSKWETYTDNEDQIANKEYELSELESIYEFSIDSSVKEKIESLKFECDALKSIDLTTNQIKLDNLGLRLKLLLDEEKK